MTTVKCSNIYTIEAEANEAYTVVFPSVGTACISNDTDAELTVWFNGSLPLGNEKIVIPEGEAVNDLLISAGYVKLLFDSSVSDGTVGIMFLGR